MNKNDVNPSLIQKDFPSNSAYFLCSENCEERYAFARLLHGYDNNADGDFIIAQLATVPRVLQEETFFGAQEYSWINQAKGGTLVISEIDSLVPSVQRRFAHMLQEGVSDFRIVMTSAHDRALLLEPEALETGLHDWLKDLDSRYCVDAERIRAAQCLSSETLSGFSALVEPLLREHVREWLNAEIDGLHGHIIAEVERPLIMMTLDYTRGNQIKAAALLGVNRNTLRKKIRELKIMVSRNDKKGRKKEEKR